MRALISNLEWRFERFRLMVPVAVLQALWWTSRIWSSDWDLV
jgi:hypothetical protein